MMKLDEDIAAVDGRRPTEGIDHRDIVGPRYFVTEVILVPGRAGRPGIERLVGNAERQRAEQGIERGTRRVFIPCARRPKGSSR